MARYNWIQILLSIIWISFTFATPAFHTINDIDLNGQSCPLPTIRNQICSPLCVKSIDLCPDKTKFNCKSGSQPCPDGTCKPSCEGVKNLCSCGSSRSSYVPCLMVSLIVTIPNFNGSRKSEQIGEVCSNLINLPSIPVWKPDIEDDRYWGDCPTPDSLSFTFKEPIWITVFSIALFEIALFSIWLIYKKWRESGISHMHASDESTTNLTKTEKEEFSSINERFPIIGFQKNLFGSITAGSFVVVSLGWLVYLAVITADYYGRITGAAYGIALESYDLSSSMFIGVWVLATSWFVTLSTFRFRLANFFRIKCSPLEAEYIQIAQPIIPTLLLDDGSKILAHIRSLEAHLKRCLGYDQRITTVSLLNSSSGLLYFTHQCQRYVFNEVAEQFQPYDCNIGATSNQFLNLAAGLSNSDASQRLELKGPNFISVKIPNFFHAFFEELSGFFFLYQLLIMWLFYYLDYWIIGVIDTAVILLSALIKVVVRLHSEKRIKKMAEHQDSVKILRDNQWVTLTTSDLVPGDVFQLETHKVVPVDGVLLNGNCVVDESSLTGEPLPIRKFSLKNESRSFDHLGADKIHYLFSGSTIKQISPSQPGEPVCGLVLQTGTLTDKGQLVCKILFPNPISFIFDEQLKLVVMILAAWGFFLFCMSLWLQKKGGTASWFYGMFCLAQILSPLLPAALVVGQSVAARVLGKNKIHCVDLSRIMVAGKVQIFCFDKTGTLTKEGLEFYGGVPRDNDSMLPIIHESSELPSLFQLGLATCHSVTQVDGTKIGNPVDIEMFNATSWKLASEIKESYVDTFDSPQGDQAHIVKRFEFVHARASMSVAVLDPSTGHTHVFVKGSFEKVAELVTPESIPNNYNNTAFDLTGQGCYVLAIAHRDLGIIDENHLKEIKREELESEVSLLGMIVFKNQLKDDTQAAIEELKSGNTRTVMITGDAIRTGIFIADACGMLPRESQIYMADLEGKGEVKWQCVNLHQPASTETVFFNTEAILSMIPDEYLSTIELAMTGNAFRQLIKEDLIKPLLLSTRVFARMTPQDKVDCIQLHMERGVTAMCGDGGNDCGALRASHVGIALSEAEASIVSPFSSSTRSINSCVELLRQGRAALANSFAGYKYLIMYGETMAWLKLFTFYFSISLSQELWIIVDAFIAVGFSYAISQSKAATKLASFRPTARLLGPETLASTVGLVLINTLFLIGGFILLFHQKFFKCFEFNPSDVDLSKWYLLGDNFEGQTLGFITIFQFINSAFIYNIGFKFRQAFWRNYLLVTLWLILTGLFIYILVADPNWLGCWVRLNCGDPDVLLSLDYSPPSFTVSRYNIPHGHNVYPTYFRYILLGYCVSNMAAGILWEWIVVLGPVRNYLRQHHPQPRLRLKL